MHLFSKMQKIYFSPDTLWDEIMLLIGGHEGSNPIARLNQGFMNQHISANDAMGDLCVSISLLIVKSCHSSPKTVRSPDFAIGHF